MGGIETLQREADVERAGLSVAVQAAQFKKAEAMKAESVRTLVEVQAAFTVMTACRAQLQAVYDKSNASIKGRVVTCIDRIDATTTEMLRIYPGLKEGV